MDRRMGGRRAAGIAVVVAVGVLLLSAGTGLARERVYLGLGLSGVGVADGFEGNTIVLSEANEIVYPGELENGGGLHGVVGALLTELVAVEVAVDAYGHESTHQAFPGIKKDASVTSISAGARVIGNLGDAFEVFGRGALGAYTLTYEQSAQLPADNLPRDDAEYSGVGMQLGGGAALLLGPVGLELGLMHHRVNFGTLATPFGIRRVSGSNTVLNAVTFTVFYHFSPTGSGGGSGSEPN